MLNLDEDMGQELFNRVQEKPSRLSTSPRVTRDLNREFERLISLVCGVIEEFKAYDTSRIAVSVSRSRRNGRVGTLAYVVPLRYVGGEKERKGRRFGLAGYYSYESSQIETHQPEAKYIMTFLVPKFFSLKPEDRLETIVHELYHLHPTMRGDLRRFPPPHIHHGPTPAAYQKKVRALCAEALSQIPTLLMHPLIALNEKEIGDFKARRFNIPRHVFKPKPLSFWIVGLLFFLSSFVALAARVPVVIIKDGFIRVAPQDSAGTEIRVKRGEKFEAFQLSENREWVAVKNLETTGWIRRELLQSDQLDKHLSFRGAYVDPNVPNKLGEKKLSDKEDEQSDDTKEKNDPLKARRKKTEEEFDESVDTGVSTGSVAAPVLSLDDDFDQETKKSQNNLPVPGASSDVDERGDLEEKPTADQLAEVKLSPEELSHVEEGEKVSKAQIRAQSRLSPIKKNDFNFKSDSLSSALEGGVVTWEEDFDLSRDRAIVVNGGKLFERPSESSRRYGILSEGDAVLPLAHTEDGLWLRVRLQETGEEGWFPSASIKVTQAESPTSTALYRNLIELHGGFGSRGQGLGGGLGYQYGISYDEKQRFWALGLDFSYWVGESLVSGAATYSSKYYGISAFGRYYMPSSTSNFSAAVEIGLGYYQALISTGGIAESILSENGLSAEASQKFVPLVGASLRYGITSRFDVLSLVRVQLSSTAQVYGAIGLGGKF